LFLMFQAGGSSCQHARGCATWAMGANSSDSDPVHVAR
jgi:hypothetical protein